MRGRVHPGGADSASERWEGTLGGSRLLWLPRTVFVLPPTHPPTHLSSHPVIHSSILPVIHPSILPVIFIIHPSFCLAVWSLSCIQFFVTPWTVALYVPLSFSISQSLLRFMSLSQSCYLTISSSSVLFSSCTPSFPASGSFPMSWLFTLSG